MRRVFTDERFPGVQLVNERGRTFQVWNDAQLLYTFESWENLNGTLSEAFAQRRAHTFFEHLSRTDLSALGETLEGDLDHTHIFSVPDQKPSSSEIDSLMAMERVEIDPVKKEQLRQHILNLMRQEESVAESVVNHLLGL